MKKIFFVLLALTLLTGVTAHSYHGSHAHSNYWYDDYYNYDVYDEIPTIHPIVITNFGTNPPQAGRYSRLRVHSSSQRGSYASNNYGSSYSSRGWYSGSTYNYGGNWDPVYNRGTSIGYNRFY